ncbi:MAG: MoxR family ATPase [Polyangiaceae bacterium]|nr:MoxR family ATPase [Polyangiaceae bacterium]
MTDKTSERVEVEHFERAVGALREEVGVAVVGQREVVDGVITCMLAGSHALLEGVPGLGKTLLVRTLAQAVGLTFSRVQFTPDLMPADILGTTVIEETPGGRPTFEFRRGPIFAHVVLADEVNRATPKTQSALLEAMQEHSVTIGRTTHRMEEPYFVLATQNPLEMEGTYPLPEAQLDRFFLKLQVPFPTREELLRIVQLTTGESQRLPREVVTRDDVLRMQALVRRVPVADPVSDYAIRLVLGTHPDQALATDKVRRFVRSGASPRGAQALLLGAKIRALFAGRFAAAIDDVRAVAPAALRHRVLLSFEGEAEGVKTDEVIGELLARLPETAK